MKPKSAFTLIELLVVIAILGILMALLFPAVNGALLAAKKAMAQNDVVQIANSCVAYETEYGRLPTNSANSTVSGDLLKSLMGTNPRGIIFLEVQNARERKKSGYLSDGGGKFVDPWGGVYQIAFDTNYSSHITTAGTNNSTEVRKNVAVWNDPSRHWDANEPSVKGSLSRRYVVSW